MGILEDFRYRNTEPSTLLFITHTRTVEYIAFLSI